jgi:hypothetical protein
LRLGLKLKNSSFTSMVYRHGGRVDIERFIRYRQVGVRRCIVYRSRRRVDIGRFFWFVMDR